MSASCDDVRTRTSRISPIWNLILILDDFVGEVLPNVNVLGAPPTTNDVVSPLDARRVVLVHWCRKLLGKAELFKELAEI
jgi:hypothetical protein